MALALDQIFGRNKFYQEGSVSDAGGKPEDLEKNNMNIKMCVDITF